MIVGDILMRCFPGDRPNDMLDLNGQLALMLNLMRRLLFRFKTRCQNLRIFRNLPFEM